MRLGSCVPWFLGPQFLSWGYGKPSIGTSLGQARTHKHHTRGARQHSEKPSMAGGWDGRATVASILGHRDPPQPCLHLVHLRGKLIFRALLGHGLWVP